MAKFSRFLQHVRVRLDPNVPLRTEHLNGHYRLMDARQYILAAIETEPDEYVEAYVTFEVRKKDANKERERLADLERVSALAAGKG